MGYTAVVSGATGLVGRELVRLLLASEAYDKVIALVRRRVELQHDKLIRRIVDYERLDSALAEEEVQGAHIFCALGTTIKVAGSQEQFRKVDQDYPMRLGELAQKYGAAVFVIVTAMGADRGSAFFYNRVKGEVEEGLRQLDLKALHILRPSFILGERAERRPGEKFAAAASKLLTPLMVGALRPYRPIPAASIAGAMMKSALRQSRSHIVYSSDEIASFHAANP